MTLARSLPTCRETGCGRPVTARGWCTMHYQRARKWGSPSTARDPRKTRRRVCSCGQLIAHRAGSGRPRKYCGERCRHHILGVSFRQHTCSVCGSRFQALRRRADPTCSYACLLASCRKPLRQATCPCGTSFETSAPAKRYCSAECRARANSARRWERRPRPNKYNRQKVLARDDWTCYLCGGRIRRDLEFPHALSPSVDHVIPVSAGGSDDPSNLRAAHWGCNEAKGDKLPDEMPAGFGGWANTKGAE